MTSLSLWIRSFLLVFATMTVIAGLGVFKYLQVQAQMSADPPPEQPVSVREAQAGPIEFRQRATMIGTVLAPRSIVLSNEIAGTVSAIHLEAGGIAEKGDILVELDTTVLEAQLESAKALAEKAESTFQRLTEASRVVARDELEEAEAVREQSRAQVKELQAMIDKKTLRAPFRARIGLSDTHEGQFLPSGSEIVSLQSVEDFRYVDFMIPQSASDSVAVGQAIQLRAQGAGYEGRIHALDAQADRSSRNRTGRIKVQLPDSTQERLVPGESVEVVLEYGPPQSAVAVPVEALQNSPMQTFVYVIIESEQGELRARERIVVPGPTVKNQICVLSGLEVGERVVSDGAFKLRDGALINIVPPDPSN